MFKNFIFIYLHSSTGSSWLEGVQTSHERLSHPSLPWTDWARWPTTILRLDSWNKDRLNCVLSPTGWLLDCQPALSCFLVSNSILWSEALAFVSIACPTFFLLLFPAAWFQLFAGSAALARSLFLSAGWDVRLSNAVHELSFSQRHFCDTE